MQSFSSLTQKNILDTRRWQTPDELRLAFVTWIEETYHRRWHQHTLAEFTPGRLVAIHRCAAHAA